MERSILRTSGIWGDGTDAMNRPVLTDLIRTAGATRATLPSRSPDPPIVQTLQMIQMIQIVQNNTFQGLGRSGAHSWGISCLKMD